MLLGKMDSRPGVGYRVIVIGVGAAIGLLLQAFHSIRSERQLIEGLEFDLPFRWFAGIGVDDAVRDHSTF